ncbi:MAG: hypothetical protein IT210_24895 [Armatimonadetes bacterium]|nr:hypothetical protein [Armatimonadota bacterium]
MIRIQGEGIAWPLTHHDPQSLYSMMSGVGMYLPTSLILKDNSSMKS